jgi:sorting nexin-13
MVWWQVLWPNGVFISSFNTPQQTDIATGCSPSGETAAKESGHVKITAPLSFEQQLEAARRASVVHDILLGELMFQLSSAYALHYSYSRLSNLSMKFTI